MTDHAEGYFEGKSGLIVKMSGEAGETVFSYKTDLSEKYAHLFRTIHELSEVSNAIDVAEATYKNQKNGPKLAYYIWAGAIVRLFATFSGNYLQHNRSSLKDADIPDDVWSALKKHRDSDLAHPGKNQETIKFGFFIKDEPNQPLNSRIRLNPYQLNTSYPPFDSAYSIVSSILLRLINACNRNIQDCHDRLITEMCDQTEAKLKESTEFQITLKENAFYKNYGK